MKKILRIILGVLAVTFALSGVAIWQEAKAGTFTMFAFAALWIFLFFKVKPKNKNGNITDKKSRNNAKAELLNFLKTKPKVVIVLDLETNGLTGNKSVLSVGAIKYNISENNILTEKERFVRYYFAKEREDPSAIIVNGLTKKKIEELRGKNCIYPKYFYEDFSSFTDFCSGCLHYIIFNAKFDMQFIKHAEDVAEYDWHIFDAMTTNTDILCLNWNENKQQYKYPSLKETLDFYEIERKSSRLHSADYDAEMTAAIFKEMLNRAGLIIS
ncbi:3'-5' exonuclease [Treponema lecithinolyticum]